MGLVGKSRGSLAADHFRRSERVPLTCEINHETYCSKVPHKAKHDPVRIFRNMEERESYIASNDEDEVAGFKDLNMGSGTRDLESRSLDPPLSRCNG